MNLLLVQFLHCGFVVSNCIGAYCCLQSYKIHVFEVPNQWRTQKFVMGKALVSLIKNAEEAIIQGDPVACYPNKILENYTKKLSFSCALEQVLANGCINFFITFNNCVPLVLVGWGVGPQNSPCVRHCA